jgi:DNA (cytosine-5)-methyltransferase 1
LYRPKYAILENVVHMAYKIEGLDKEKVCSQLIGYLVAMGYQVQ